MNWDIIIIGAGASGLMAAQTAAKLGRRVLVLEQMEKCGKKLLATGNGKCNFTNASMEADAFFGDKKLIQTVLSHFTNEDCLTFFHEIGIYPKCKNGYYYPASEQASSVVTAFAYACKQVSVTMRYSVCVQAILPQKQGFLLKTNDGTFFGKKVIIACGLLASPKLGSNGSLFQPIKALGHHFRPVLPVLCGFYAKGLPFKKISGVRTHAAVAAMVNGTSVGTDTGELQFTDYGISGIPIFQISHYLSTALYAKKNVTVSINLLPDFTEKQLMEELQFRNGRNENLLNGLLNQKLADVLLPSFSTNSSGVYAKETLKKLSDLLQNMIITVEKPRDFTFAQVCTGGISAKEINCSTLESKYVPNLYFAGEILDVDGICGGYNLHFAWGSGFLAAFHASQMEAENL